MRRPFQKVSIVALLVLFAFSIGSDVFSKGFRSSGRSYGSRSYSSRSSSRTSSRSSRPSTSSSSRSYGSSVRSTSRSVGQSSSRSYGSSTVGSSRTSTARSSSAVRQKQSAMSSAKTGSAISTKNMTSSQRRSLQAQQRRGTRNLKAENRSLKRQVGRADRNTARARRDARSQITVNNFGAYYPTMGYSMYSLTASMVFANMISGIYFHDYYNHRLHHSWLWYHHHPNYDRSHWSREKQMEYERWNAYYDSQGIKPDLRYVDPDTNRDEDYIESHVEKNADKFYGENAEETVTVEEMPDEKALSNVVLAGGSQTASTSAVQAQPQRIVVQKKTSGGAWFVLVFGSILIIGIVVLIMYNKGYF